MALAAVEKSDRDIVEIRARQIDLRHRTQLGPEVALPGVSLPSGSKIAAKYGKGACRLHRRTAWIDNSVEQADVRGRERRLPQDLEG
jgi:hypothetical protein